MAGLISRRGLLHAGGAAAVSSVAGAAEAAASVAAPLAAVDRIPSASISIQLFTLRDQLALDLEGTLRRLREIGYRQVEHAGFVGRTAAEFKTALDKAGLRATSGHAVIPQPFDATTWQAALADARLLGSRYIVHPLFGISSHGPIRDRGAWTAFAHDLTKAGQLARAAGLGLGYHNHNSEFLRLSDGSGETGYDVLVAETDPSCVHFEIDLFWAWRGAVDPVELLRKVAPRVLQYHVKDLDTSGGFADPGRGLIDFARIFRAHAVDQYIVERDDAGSLPRLPGAALETAKAGYDFLQSVRY